MSKRFLVRCTGFIGDILFASSIAKKLHEEHGEGTSVDYYIPFPQPKILLSMNPYINDVYDEYTFNPSIYIKIIDIPAVNQQYPATVQFQQAAQISNITPEFPVWTVDSYDDAALDMLVEVRKLGKPVVAWQSNWSEKTLRYTLEQYEARTEHGHRNIETIINILNDHVTLVEVGLPVGVTQHSDESKNPYLYAMTASVIKHCDWMIGGEGGLTNLSAAVGTPTIITTDHLYKQYGPLGNYHRLNRPAMGPLTYFPEGGHVHLNPFLTDVEVAHAILDCIGVPGAAQALNEWWFNE